MVEPDEPAVPPDPARPPKPVGARPVWLRWPLFFLLGILLTIVSFVLESRLLRLVFVDGRPAWVGALRFSIVVMPWVLATFLLVGRIATRRPYPWLAFSLGAALPWMLVLYIHIGPLVSEYLQRRDFDAEAWRAAAATGTGTPSQERIRMVDDLIDSGLLDGKGKEEVQALLGPDDRASGPGHGQRYFRSWDAVYWLGRQRGFIGIDSEWLVIRYDGDERVQEYRIVYD